MMKVLHFIPSMGAGGAERQLSSLAAGLSGAGIETHIAYRSDGPNLENARRAGAVLHKLNASSNHSPSLLLDCLRLIDRTGADVVQTWLLQMDICAGAAALLRRKPWIISERSSAQAYPAGLKTGARAFMGRLSDAVIANSPGGATYWREQRHPGLIQVIPNAVAAGPGGRQEPRPGPLLLFVGRLSPEKNVQMLVDAFVQVLSVRPEASAVIIGTGPLEDDLRQRIARAGMAERIEIIGYTDDVQSWMRVASLCVSISHFEGLPNVVLEAAHVECPLLLSRVPAHESLFEENAVAYTTALSSINVAEDILRTLSDPAVPRRVETAKGSVSHLTLASVCEAYTSAYTEVLRARQSRLAAVRS